jgi:putative ABC transport system permease protein
MAFLFEIILLAFGNLRLRMLRSILTALGIIFGVAAVIIMSSLGEGKKQQALSRIEALGARNVIARSQKPPEVANQGQSSGRSSFTIRFGITRNDLEVIRQNFPDADAIVPLKEVGGQILRNELRRTSQAFGTTPDLLRVANLRVGRGRYISESDMDQESLVIVIGADVAEKMFPLEDPIGQTLRIDAKPFTVIGVLEPIGLAGGAGASMVGRDMNLDAHVPMTTARATFGDTVTRRESGNFQSSDVQVSEIYLSVPERERVIVDAERLRRLLASVTERTREIGIRRAIGATRGNILTQFLVETGALAMIGGLIGVGLGVGGSVLLGWVVPNLVKLPYIGSWFPAGISLPTSVTGWSIILSFVVATLTGLVFGLYPARRAAAQDPIVALRHD